MKLQFKYILLILLLPAVAVANNGKFKGKYTKEKKLSKEYTVNPDALLSIDNSFGNVDIVSWNENRTVIDVTIIANGNNEEKVQKRLNEINVEFSGSATAVSAKTIFKNKKGSWNNWSKKNNVQIEINYKIKVPVKNTLDLDNNYGAISLTSIDGKAKINCDYGQLIIGELNADGNSLNFDYTSKSTIDYMKSGSINADYSGFTLGKVGDLDLNADYTKSVISEANNVTYNCDYGKVEIEKAASVNGRGDYVTNRLGEISGNVSLNTDYGSIGIEKLTANAKNVAIKANYTGIKIGFASAYNFNFNIDLSYASLKGSDAVIVTKTDKSNSNKSYEGYHGSQNSGNTLTINSDYGSVSFIKN